MRIFLLVSALSIALIALVGGGCDLPQPKEVSREAIGKIVDAEVAQTSWNEAVKTRIKTERYVAIVLGSASCPLGVDAYLVKYDDGQTYLAWDGSERRYAVIQ
jgi:uncharacterized membrane protein